MSAGRYVPSIGKLYRVNVHEWDASFNGGHAAKTACGAITALVDKVEPTEDAVTCPACLKVAK